MNEKEKRRRVKEPVQVYLDASDRDLLETLVHQTGWSRAEILRRGIRRLADAMERGPVRGASLAALTGALEGGTDLPPDLAVRHDDYLYGTGVGDSD